MHLKTHINAHTHASLHLGPHSVEREITCSGPAQGLSSAPPLGHK